MVSIHEKARGEGQIYFLKLMVGNGQFEFFDENTK
jgi:hypothetical protein